MTGTGLLLVEAQHLVVGQDRGLELAQLVARFEAEVFDEEIAAGAVDVERFGLPAGAVEREHQLTARAFPQRVLGDHALQFTDERVMAAQQQLDVDAVLQHRQAFLVET